MKQAVLPALIATLIAAAPALAGDEPVVIIPEHNAAPFPDHASYWRSWAQDFSSELRHEMGTWISPRMGAKVVKGAPYSADVVTETRQMLPDGNDISRPPLATIKLPFAMPMAFHGSWMAAQQ